MSGDSGHDCSFAQACALVSVATPQIPPTSTSAVTTTMTSTITTSMTPTVTTTMSPTVSLSFFSVHAVSHFCFFSFCEPLSYNLSLQQFPPFLTTHPTSTTCSVISCTNTPVASTDQTSTTIPLVVLLGVVSVTLLVSVSLNIALWFRVKRHTETNGEW